MKKTKKYIFLHIYNGKTLKGLAELYAETNAHKQGKKKHVQQAHVFRIYKRESFPNVNKSFFFNMLITGGTKVLGHIGNSARSFVSFWSNTNYFANQK